MTSTAPDAVPPGPDGAAPSQAAPVQAAAREIDPRLLEILVCPSSRGPLVFRRETSELVSASARLAYPVRNGVPILLVDEARELADDE